VRPTQTDTWGEFVTDNIGSHPNPTDPVRAAVVGHTPAVRAAVIEVEEGERRQPRLADDQLRDLIARVDGLRSVSDYSAMVPLLPELLIEAAARGGTTLAQAGYCCSVSLRNLGYRDLALSAARIGVVAAHDAEHLAWLGAAEFAHILAMPVEAAPTAARVTDRALAALQRGAADVEVRQMLGQLHLTNSLTCAVAGRPDDAAAHLAAAGVEADSLGDPQDGAGFNFCSFGPTNVALWRMSVNIELGECGRAVETAGTFTPEPLRMANRHQAYWMCLGRALAHSGRTDREALVAFTRAERAAPTAFALHPFARDTISAMVYRARHRSVPEELRVLARRVGVDVPL
jgi:hypothetical protein